MVSNKIHALIMRDDYYGTATVSFFPENVQDALRAFCICECRRFIKHQYLRFANQHTGEADTLAFATTQAFAALSYKHVKAIA